MEVLSTWKCYGSWVVNVKGQGQVTKLRYIPRLSCILFHLYVLFYLLFMYIRPISWLYFAAFCQHLIIKHVMMVKTLVHEVQQVQRSQVDAYIVA